MDRRPPVTGAARAHILPGMRFDLVDAVLQQTPESIATVKQVSLAEEYLRDHFPGFPILPGVMMLEAMVQAARALLRQRDAACARHVLGTVRALKYGAMVKPGDSIRVDVSYLGQDENDAHSFKGVVRLVRAGQGAANLPDDAPQAASGRFTLRPIRYASARADAASASAANR